jgi:hypothetical protein
MFNPILHELVAHEQYNDHLRQAEQSRLAKAAIVRQPAHRFDLRTSLGYLLIAVGYLFKALAHTDKEPYDATHHAFRPVSANEGWCGRGLQRACPVKVTPPKRK